MQTFDEHKKVHHATFTAIPTEELKGFKIGSLVQYIGYPSRFNVCNELTIGTNYIVTGIIKMSKNSDVIFIQIENDFHIKVYLDSKNFKMLKR